MSLLQLAVQTAQVFIAAAAFYQEELVLNLNV